MKEKLIIALDVDTRDEALKLVDQLWNVVGAFKIGMQLYNAEGPKIVKEIHDLGGKVFVDLKFHDIPNTVDKASRVVARQGVLMFNVHAAGGLDMMRGAAVAAEEVAHQLNIPKPLVIAVTVLTSFAQQAFEQEVGIPRLIEHQVVEWAKLAKTAGLDGVVASPREIVPIREACGTDFHIVTPGVRPTWAAANDQKRVMTPGEAVKAGATYLVIGRPITGDNNPREAAERIVEEMEAGKNA